MTKMDWGGIDLHVNSVKVNSTNPGIDGEAIAVDNDIQHGQAIDVTIAGTNLSFDQKLYECDVNGRVNLPAPTSDDVGKEIHIHGTNTGIRIKAVSNGVTLNGVSLNDNYFTMADPSYAIIKVIRANEYRMFYWSGTASVPATASSVAET